MNSDAISLPLFRGVFAADQLPRQVKYPSLYVANTKGRRSKGEHWVCFYFGPNREAEYFDSLGRPPRLPWHRDFLKRNARRYITTPSRIQSLDSELCGQYCIMFAMHRARGVSLFSFLSRFSIYDYDLNDDKVIQWFVKNVKWKNKTSQSGQGCCRGRRVSHS